MADARESRLPKWAQEELGRLRRSLEAERARNAELRADVGETNIHVQNYSSDDQPIVKGASIHFGLDDKRWDSHITVRVDGRDLWVHGGRTLVIHPHVSNAFRVRLGDR
ncbi:hypothetical protein [Streptomyces sioyaensis]|uniref:DUF7239 family protein n=1 Tax=Streptomyces sioyaensis TaxID=67364 RepID=UPI0037B3DC7B